MIGGQCFQCGVGVSGLVVICGLYCGQYCICGKGDEGCRQYCVKLDQVQFKMYLYGGVGFIGFDCGLWCGGLQIFVV